MSPTTDQFYNSPNKYYEVDYLAQQRIFIDDNESELANNPQGYKIGKWVDVSKKFIVEYDEYGVCSLIFGSGDESASIKTILNDGGVSNREFLNNLLNNTSLGEKLKPNHTLFDR